MSLTDNGSLVRRLLSRNMSMAQICGYAFSSLIGLSIVLTAIQFYRDASGIFKDGETNAMQQDFIVVSKQVGLTERNVSFSPDEINDIKAQPWVNSIGAFTASRFKATIGVDFAGRGMTTESFFESIPDKFFDRLPDDWHFDPELGERADVPIILSRDYLALYNFGFASTRGLPTLREGEIGMIPLVVNLYGADGHVTRMRGHIAGFSSRINTIAVPEAFMQWANGKFAPASRSNDVQPSRLVLEINTPGDPAIASYMERNSLDIAGDKLDNGTAAYFLRVMTAVVIAVGAIISALAFFILMLSIYLLLQKNREKLHQLMLLGYSPAQTAVPYVALILIVNSSVLILASVTAVAASSMWAEALRSLDAEPVSATPTIATGLVIMTIVSVINIMSVRKRIRNDF